VRENLGDFRKSIQILPFLSPLPHVPLPFTKMNVLHYDLKKDAINEFEIKYWTSNPVWVTFQEHGSSFYVNIEEKVWLLVKKIRTKTSLFDRNWATSLKPRRRNCPLRETCSSAERNAKILIDFRKSPRFSLTLPLSQEREKSSRPVFTMCGESWW
jgi:hypothetical protein